LPACKQLMNAYKAVIKAVLYPKRNYEKQNNMRRLLKGIGIQWI